MTYKEAVTSVLFKKYATFNGRASRSEYWWFILFYTALSLGLENLDFMLGWKFGEPSAFGSRPGVLDLIFSLATFLPSICVGARRLHDVNRSGWWMLMGITIIGIIPLLYWLVKKPEDNEEGRENKWGRNPLLDENHSII
ncbi:MAG: DUF805 domain-containing protein [Porticoccaceae bacterium]|jgi:uncharacterized membrane protein YhaH (DUF805 family)|nr:DUF805 domain-containing protein [Porticoccaceae bacterium]|tara:strand:- start:509 stop:928 length:420 start_codon:yes stop_codon:yes gene_type:complete